MQLIVQGYPAYAYTGAREFDPARPAAVFVHGAAFDHSVWQWQSRYFANHGLSVLAVDLPGHGKSPGAPRATIEAMAHWIAALLDAAGLERAALVGHSMGALATLDAALRYPQRVSKLALVGAAVPMAVGAAFRAAAQDDSPAGLDMEAVWGHARNISLSTSAVPGVTLLGASRALNGRAHAGVLHADLEACNGFAPRPEALRALAVPTLVVAGQRDQMTPLRSGQALAREIPGARFVAVDAGHSMMSEAPRAIQEALRSFL